MTQNDPFLNSDGEFKPVPDVTSRQVHDLRRRFPDRAPAHYTFDAQTVAWQAGQASVVRVLAASLEDPMSDDVDADELAQDLYDMGAPRRPMTPFERTRQLSARHHR